MDEADLLSNHIIFIAAGKIRASGEPLALKRQHGRGYTLTCHLSKTADRDSLARLIQSHVTSARLRDDTTCDVAWVLPFDQRISFDVLLEELDRQSEQLGVCGYGLSATSLEEVIVMSQPVLGSEL